VRAAVLLLVLGCGSKDTAPGDKDTAETTPARCPTTLSYRTDGDPDEVQLAGSFNDWTPQATPLTQALPGMWVVSLDLEPGVYPYKFVEFTAWSHGGAELWTCDALNPLIHCEEGTAADLGWVQDCGAGSESCNSLLVVEDCSKPRIDVVEVEVDRDARTVDISLTAAPSLDSTDDLQIEATIGQKSQTAVARGDGMFHVKLSGLDAGRSTIEIRAVDSSQQEATQTIPLWMDDFSWDQAVLYHAMIDRVANLKTKKDSLEGTSHPITDYAGGDFAGLQAALPYLEDLGVNALWLSNPQAGPTGAWAGDCNATYAGYHGFWPADWDKVDPHLGSKADLKSLIQAAHNRGMRVVMDWVGNHVHQDHPVLSDWPVEATHEEAICNQTGPDGALNWDRIPESCWFAPYLPDLDQAQPEVLDQSIEKALEWAREYELDGLRVDAAKHMPHSVSWNLSSQVEAQLQHRGTGFDFYLVGETFDGADAINAFVGPEQLDGQFDFPLYWQLREAFITDSASLRDVVSTASAMHERYPEGRMSTFLGNLDVGRFVTTAAEWTQDVCPDGEIRQADVPAGDDPYDRLLMAWTFLFSQPGIPLIYYGDELGLPGYGDPDNRQPLWWMADVMAGDVQTVASTLQPGPARVLRGVQALTRARREHPALATGTTSEWWAAPAEHPSLYAYSRTQGDDAALIILSRWTDEVSITNTLSFAGLPQGVTYEDVLTGEAFVANGDELTVTMLPMSARLLLPRAD
jgi:glycosidase